MMSDNEGERGRAKQDWFLEHGSIQAELMKLKKEALRSKAEETGKKKVSNGDPSREAPSGEGTENGPGQRGGPGQEPSELKDECQPIDRAQSPPHVDRVDDVVNEVEGGGSEGRAPRLPTGKIPTAPNLSQKIASVIQLENKLKRRKYEMERNSREKVASAEESASPPKEAPDVTGTPTLPAPEPVMVASLDKDGPLTVPSEIQGTSAAGPDESAPRTVPDVPVQETAQVRTDLDLDIGREAKVEGPLSDQNVPAPPKVEEMSPADGATQRPGIDGQLASQPIPEEEQPIPDAEVPMEGRFEMSTPLQDDGTEMDRPDDRNDKGTEGTGSPFRTNGERSEPGRNSKEWLEVAKGPKRPAKREEKGSSPFGRILGLFKRKGK